MICAVEASAWDGWNSVFGINAVTYKGRFGETRKPFETPMLPRPMDGEMGLKVILIRQAWKLDVGENCPLIGGSDALDCSFDTTICLNEDNC